MADITVPKTEEQYINQIYDKQRESTLRTLKSAYDTNVSAVDTAENALASNTYEAKRQAAGDAAITRQRLNETFAANGLNTGAVGQANLALLNQKASNLNDIEVKRVQAQNEYEAQKAALTQAYQAEVKSAIEKNDADKAAALYAAWKEQQALAAAVARGGSGGGGSTVKNGNGGGAGQTDFYAKGDTVLNKSNSRVTYQNDNGEAELLAALYNGEITPTKYAELLKAKTDSEGTTRAK